MTTFYLTLDNSFHVISGNSYKVMMNSDTGNVESWSVETFTNDPYDGGSYNATGRDLNFSLYTPDIVASIYLDKTMSYRCYLRLSGACGLFWCVLWWL